MKTHIYRTIPYVICLAIGILFSGCSGGEEPKSSTSGVKTAKSGAPAPTSSSSKPESQPKATKKPEAKAPVDGPEVLAEIAAANNVVKLHRLIQTYKERGVISVATGKAIDDKWKNLTTGMVSKTLIDGLDILSVDSNVTGAKEITFSFLLHSTKKLDTDYHLTVWGSVTPENLQFIKPFKPDALSTQWYLLFGADPTSQWKPGEYHVAQLRVVSENIPYNIKVRLHTRNADNVWSGSSGNYVEMGWQVADTSDFVKLYMIEKEYNHSGKRTSETTQALRDKWKNLTAKMTPKNLIQGLDILTVDTKVTGKKELTFSFLLHTTSDLSTDYHLTVWGKVAPEHMQLIKEFQPKSLSTEWSLLINDDPTSKWKADQYRVVQLKVSSEIIPYNLKVRLHNRDSKGTWSGSPGNYAELGWQTVKVK